MSTRSGDMQRSHFSLLCQKRRRYRPPLGGGLRVAASGAGALLAQPRTMRDFTSRFVKKTQVVQKLQSPF